MFADGQGLIDVIQPKTDLTNVIKGAKAVIQKVADATQIRKKGLSVFLASRFWPSLSCHGQKGTSLRKI